ncbi:MAG TPA: HlyD family efflux transporter periplasmic adaptor subunit [Blastocatellia bacterium]|nr:HlyD family efflux transporter periplasmic adaptor subunit [Blastocatellia bacterium]
MDVPRSKSVIRNKKIRRGIYLVLLLGAVTGAYLGLARLKPAAQTVERSTVVIDTVKQKEFVRNTRGNGTLVPESIVWIPASINGRVEKRLVQAGNVVKPETVIVELSNPELQQQVLDAELQLKSAEADYNNRKVELETGLLNQRAQAATVEADYLQAKLEAEANGELAKDKLVSSLVLKKSITHAAELATRHDLEKQRIAMNTEAMKTQLSVSQSTLEQRRALYQLRLRQLGDLKVKAGMSGILQELSVQVGQQVTVGTNLARVSDPTRLKAEIKVPETLSKDVREGQVAEIDTRNGIIPGRVSRIDPAVVNGTRTVDVQLLGALPDGAVPDANVEGTIIFERLDNLIQIQRPAFGQERSTIKLFRLEPDEQHAELVTVELGRAAVTVIEVVRGLKVGDKVIVSDTTSQVGDTTNRIRLN